MNTVAKVLKSVESVLRRQEGFELVEFQALTLVSAATGVPLPQLDASSERPLSRSEVQLVNDYLGNHPLRPVPLFLGYFELFGIRINVSDYTLLPGTETAGLIDIVLELSSQWEAPLIVDIGTGSGIVPLVVGIRRPKARLVATDVSADALTVAAKNFYQHRLTGRVRWAQGDWLSPLAQFDLVGRVNIIVSNPPYVCTAAIEHLPQGFQKYAPRLAIDGGHDGMDGHRAIAAGASRYLKPGGYLALQTDRNQAHHVSAIVQAVREFEMPKALIGTCGEARFVIARKVNTPPIKTE